MSNSGVRLLTVLVGLLVVLGGGQYFGAGDTTAPVAPSVAASCETGGGAGYIDGTVRDADGNLIDDRVVEYTIVNATTNETVVASDTTDGTFTVLRGSGGYYATASADGYDSGQTATFCVEPNRTTATTVVLEDSSTDGSVTISVVDQDNNHLKEVTVELWRESDYDDPAQRLRSGTTDSRGEVMFTGLAVGSDSDNPLRYIARIGANNDSLETITTTLELYEPTQTSDSSTAVTQYNQNKPPEADAGLDRTVTAGQSITLDGSESSDPDGDSLSYSWNGTQYLSEISSARPTFDTPNVDTTETYTATLLVDDGNGGSDTDSVTITVEPGNDPPTADAGPDRTVTAGQSITLDGTGSSDPDGDTLVYSWSGNPYLSNTDSPTPTFDAPEIDSATTYTATLTVDDGNGASDSDRVTIAIEPPAESDFRIVETAVPDAVTAGKSIAVNVTIENAGDASGTEVVSYLFDRTVRDTTDLTLRAGERQSVILSYDTGNATAGTHTHGVRVDGQNVTRDIDIMPSNDLPTADAGPDQTVTAGQSITLDGSESSDPDGDSLSYYWNGTQYLSETSSARPTFDTPDVDTTETYTATLLVDDGNGGSDTDSVAITVEPQPLEANDLDGDGDYEDVDGDGSFSVLDAGALDSNLDADWVQDNVEKFDFNGDGAVNSADVCELRREAGSECQPTFEVVNFDAPGSIQRGESIDVSTTVENTGDGNGTGTVSYAIGGTVVSSQTVSLAPGDSSTVSFTVSPDDLEPAEYQQAVLTDDDTREIALTVTSAATDTSTDADTTTLPRDGTTSDTGTLPPDRTTTSASDGAPLGPLGAGALVVLLVVGGVTAARLRPDDSRDENSLSSSPEDDRNSDMQTAQSETSDEGATDNSPGRPGSTGTSDRSAVPDTLTYDDFERGERIGSGGNADVYRATVAGTNGPAEVALKEPRIEGTISTTEVERLLSEAETWAKLDDHEHIVAVYDWDSQPLPWIAMEYMDGSNLATAPPLTYDRSVDVLESVASAIEYAHRAGVAHGDLKPSNVLFAGDPETGVPKVGDWGLAKILLEHSQSTEGLSPAYAAPEQFQGGSQDIVGPQLTDIYQLGAVAYEVFTGQPPFEGTPFEVMEQVRSEQPTPPTEINPSLPSAVDELIARSMAKDPSDRYEAMIDFRRALEEF